eukprot:2669853-Rhodomonas_salina.2
MCIRDRAEAEAEEEGGCGSRRVTSWVRQVGRRRGLPKPGATLPPSLPPFPTLCSRHGSYPAFHVPVCARYSRARPRVCVALTMCSFAPAPGCGVRRHRVARVCAAREWLIERR